MASNKLLQAVDAALPSRPSSRRRPSSSRSSSGSSAATSSSRSWPGSGSAARRCTGAAPSSSRPRRDGSRSSPSGSRRRPRARSEARRRDTRARRSRSRAASRRGAAGAPAPAFRVLAFTKTTGYRHASIPAAIAALQKLGAQNGFAVDQHRGRGRVHRREPRAVQGRRLPADDRRRPRRQPAGSPCSASSRPGDGWVGVHSAADTEYDWPWYGGLLGAYFESHPAIQQATLNVTDPTDPSTARAAREAGCAPTSGTTSGRTRAPTVHVLLTIDETTYDPAGARWAPTIRSPGRTTTTAGARCTPRSGTPTSRTPSRSSSPTCSAGSSGRPGRSDGTPRPFPRRRSPRSRPRSAAGGSSSPSRHPACACDASRPRRAFAAAS